MLLAPLQRQGISSVPTAAYLGCPFPFHLSHAHIRMPCLFQSLMLILFFCSLSGISFTWATVYKLFYALHRQLHTSLSLCLSHHSHTYVKFTYIYILFDSVAKYLYTTVDYHQYFNWTILTDVRRFGRGIFCNTRDIKEKLNLSGQYTF